MKRTFLAIPVSEKAKIIFSSLFDDLKIIPNLKLVKPENVHFTLKYLGEVSESELIEVREKLGHFKFKPFKIELGPIGGFSIGDYVKVIWLGADNEEMANLIVSVQKLFDYLRKEEHTQITPHLTLARSREDTDQSLLRKFLQKYKNQKFGEMEVNKIVLYESKLTPSGPVYKEIESISFK